jgi:hypothetical protein
MGKDREILSPRAREDGLEKWLGIFERVLIILRLAPRLRKRSGD